MRALVAHARVYPAKKSMTVLPHCFAMHYTHREHNSDYTV